MADKAKDILKLFQGETNRQEEEAFAILFSEQAETRLFFINENSAHTDGKNIVVDPAFASLYNDTAALRQTERILGLSADCSSDPWMALHVITRAQTIHECLHILYTPFPGYAWKEARIEGTNELRVLALLGNIIEDRYINDLGRNNYLRYALLMDFNRCAAELAKEEIEGTAVTVLERVQALAKMDRKDDPIEAALSEEARAEAEKRRKARLLMDFIHYMIIAVAYPELTLEDRGEVFESIRPYVEQARPHWLEGQKAASPKDRYAASFTVFEVIRELIPDDEDEPFNEADYLFLLAGQAHSSPDASLVTVESEGQDAEIKFPADEAEAARNRAEALEAWRAQNESWKNARIDFILDEKDETDKAGQTGAIIIPPSALSTEHGKIQILVKQAKPELSMRVAYQNIKQKHQLSISSYRRRIEQLLQGKIQETEERKLFGSGISSRHLTDVKRRYWYKNSDATGIPDLSILLLIDGSGSMGGPKITQARESAVILHEVIKGQGLPFSVVLHHAITYMPLMQCDVLLPFTKKANAQLNLMQIKAGDCNRDGLALLWAQRYLAEQSFSEKAVVIVIADGSPNHYIEDTDWYGGPRAVKDTNNIVRQLAKQGLDCVAIALDEASAPCYEDLKEIYPRVVRCSDLSRLTGQLFNVITGLLN